MTTQLALATHAVVATGAPALLTPPEAAGLADGIRELQAAQQRYDQALTDAVHKAGSAEQVARRFDLVEQRRLELRRVARGAA